MMIRTLYMRCAALLLVCLMWAEGYSIKDDSHLNNENMDYDQGVLIKRTDRVQQRWKTGPSPSSWYYIMGHESPVKRKGVATDKLNHVSKLSPYQDTVDRRTPPMKLSNLFAEFTEFLYLKEHGLLASSLNRK